MNYFAYGSNMDLKRIKRSDRAPSAQFLFRAALRGYELRFTRWSDRQQTGTADAVQRKDSVVWGGVFQIEDRDEGSLDRAEGVASGAYRREQVTVFQDDDNARPLRDVVTYVVCRKESAHQAPARWYLDHIIDGANQCGLPTDYIETLERVKVAQ